MAARVTEGVTRRKFNLLFSYDALHMCVTLAEDIHQYLINFLFIPIKLCINRKIASSVNLNQILFRFRVDLRQTKFLPIK